MRGITRRVLSFLLSDVGITRRVLSLLLSVDHNEARTMPPLPATVRLMSVMVLPALLFNSRFTVGFIPDGPCATVLSVAGL